MKRIIISGEAGQGIKLLAHALANMLTVMGKEVSVSYAYDSAVRSGKINARIIYSDKKIENPIIEEADILLKLSKHGEEFYAEKIICDLGACGGFSKSKHTRAVAVEEIPFTKIAEEKFGSRIFMNMIALGKLLKLIGIKPSDQGLKQSLPSKFLEKNIKAIKYCFSARDNVY